MFRDKFFCGLDIGSQKLKAAVLGLNKEKNPELLGVHTQKTHGFQGGSVTDLAELTECIHATVRQVIKTSGIKIKSLYLGLAGDLIDSRETETVIPLVDKGNKVISQRDIRQVNHQARLLGIKMEEDILHDLPQYYIVDENNRAFNPAGLYGRKLAVKSLMIISDINRIRNMSKAVNQAGYDVEDIFFSSYASSCAVLQEADTFRGCVLVDVGSKVTSVLVFKDKRLRFLDKIGIGGDDFSESISQELNLSFELAEDIKKSHAVGIYSDTLSEEEILIRRDDVYMPLRKDVIYRAIEEKLNQLIVGIRAAVRVSGFYDQVPGGVVMIGGGSLLGGLIERLGQEINLPARLGKITIPLNKYHHHQTMSISSVGLALTGYQKRNPCLKGEKEKQGLFKTLGNHLKQLYQEYF